MSQRARRRFWTYFRGNEIFLPGSEVWGYDIKIINSGRSRSLTTRYSRPKNQKALSGLVFDDDLIDLNCLSFPLSTSC